MQISAQNLLASQQTTQVQQTIRPAPAFTAALEKTEGFAPLPLKQTAPAQVAPAPPSGHARPTRLGSLIDIKI